jgi:hypothetical protein
MEAQEAHLGPSAWDQESSQVATTSVWGVAPPVPNTAQDLIIHCIAAMASPQKKIAWIPSEGTYTTAYNIVCHHVEAGTDPHYPYKRGYRRRDIDQDTLEFSALPLVTIPRCTLYLNELQKKVHMPWSSFGRSGHTCDHRMLQFLTVSTSTLIAHYRGNGSQSVA